MYLKINNIEILANVCYINLFDYYHHYILTHKSQKFTKAHSAMLSLHNIQSCLSPL